MCPASKKPEVEWLAHAHPDLTEIAVFMERRAHARGLTTTRGLGRRWSWSEHLGLGDPAVMEQMETSLTGSERSPSKPGYSSPWIKQ